MDCKCTHFRVCSIESAITEAVESIPDPYLGGMSPFMKELSTLIRKHCRFREPLKEGDDHGRPDYGIAVATERAGKQSVA